MSLDFSWEQINAQIFLLDIQQYFSAQNRGTGMFINFDQKFLDFPIARPLFYSVLLMPARLFGPALLLGTLE